MSFRVYDLGVIKDNNNSYYRSAAGNIRKMNGTDALTFIELNGMFCDKNYLYNDDLTRQTRRDTFNLFTIMFYPRLFAG